MSHQKILVAYDGSEPAHNAVRLARWIASKEPNTEIVFVHALNIPASVDSGGLQDSMIKEANRVRDELYKISDETEYKSKVRLLKGSSPAKLLIDTALEEGCNLIIMGSRGRGGFKGYLGSVSHAVVQGSPINVLIAKTKNQPEVPEE